MLTREQAFEVFKQAATKVWSNPEFVLPVVVLSNEEPERGVLASLAMAAAPWAIGNSILRRPQRYVLRLSRRLLEDESYETVWKVMIHEAVHLGYARHDIHFRQLVREHGGAVSEYAASGGQIKVEKKVGARFQTIATFDDEFEAEAFMKQQFRLEPGRYRMTM